MLRRGHKVVWAEGVLLGQQHLQQWERYLFEQSHLRYQYSVPNGWGLASLTINEVALLNGRFEVLSCVVLFSHGVLVHYKAGGCDNLSCELVADANGVCSVYLALPANEGVANIAGYDQMNQAATWRGKYQSVADIYDSSREREVLFGEPNLMLLQQHELTSSCHTLLIAKLSHQGAKRYSLSNDFVPTVLQIGASPVLLQIVQQFTELITAKISLLGVDSELWQQGKNVLLLQTLHAALVDFKLLAQECIANPQQLYAVIIKFISKLACFSSSAVLPDLPPYQHSDLTHCFTVLRRTACELLELVMPLSITVIKLQQYDTIFIAPEIPAACFENKRFILAVKMVDVNSEFDEQWLRRVKIAAPSVIKRILSSAISGVALERFKLIAADITLQSGYVHYKLNQENGYWNEIVQERALALFAPLESEIDTMELMVVV